MLFLGRPILLCASALEGMANFDVREGLADDNIGNGFSSSLLHLVELTEDGVSELLRVGDETAERKKSVGGRTGFSV